MHGNTRAGNTACLTPLMQITAELPCFGGDPSSQSSIVYLSHYSPKLFSEDFRPGSCWTGLYLSDPATTQEVDALQQNIGRGPADMAWRAVLKFNAEIRDPAFGDEREAYCAEKLFPVDIVMAWKVVRSWEYIFLGKIPQKYIAWQSFLTPPESALAVLPSLLD